MTTPGPRPDDYRQPNYATPAPGYQAAPVKKPIWKRWWVWVLGALVAIGMISAVSKGEHHDGAPVAANPTQGQAPAAPPPPKGTVSQQNAVKKAKSYLGHSSFSRDGLIKQLEHEKFSTADATYAVDSLNVDWNDQAAKKAKSYMDHSAFSRDGLIHQLEYEGFTPEQAAHGVDSVGL